MYILYNNCQNVSCLSYLTLNEILTQLMGLKNYSLTKQVREGEREEGGEGRERERERERGEEMIEGEAVRQLLLMSCKHTTPIINECY